MRVRLDRPTGHSFNTYILKFLALAYASLISFKLVAVQGVNVCSSIASSYSGDLLARHDLLVYRDVRLASRSCFVFIDGDLDTLKKTSHILEEIN